MDSATIHNCDLRISCVAGRNGVLDDDLRNPLITGVIMLVRLIDEIDVWFAAWRNYWLPYLYDHASRETLRLAFKACRWASLAACALLGFCCCYTWMLATFESRVHVTIEAPDMTAGVIQTPLRDGELTNFFQQRINYYKDMQQDERIAVMEARDERSNQDGT